MAKKKSAYFIEETETSRGLPCGESCPKKERQHVKVGMRRYWRNGGAVRTALDKTTAAEDFFSKKKKLQQFLWSS